MGGVVGAVKGHVEQLAQELGRARRVNLIHSISGLGTGHVVRLRADTADAVGQQGHILHRAAHAETFKAAQLRNLEIGVGDIAVRV